MPSVPTNGSTPADVGGKYHLSEKDCVGGRPDVPGRCTCIYSSVALRMFQKQDVVRRRDTSMLGNMMNLRVAGGGMYMFCLFLNPKGSERDEEREGEKGKDALSIVSLQRTHNSQGWTTPKSRAQTSVRVCLLGGGDPRRQAVICCLLGCAGELRAHIWLSGMRSRCPTGCTQCLLLSGFKPRGASALWP